MGLGAPGGGGAAVKSRGAGRGHLLVRRVRGGQAAGLGGRLPFERQGRGGQVATLGGQDKPGGKMGGDGVPRVPKLDVENYLSWATEMEIQMRYKRCWSAINPLEGGASSSSATADREGTPASKDEAAVNKEEMARSLIMLKVRQHHAASLHASKRARERWETLAAEFRSQGPAREMILRTQLNQVRMKGYEIVVQYFNRSKLIVWELGVLGVEVADRPHLTALLHGLGPKFKLRGTIIASQRAMTVALALEELRAAESEMRLEAGTRKETSGASMPATDGGGRWGAQERLCFKCNKPAHIKRNCPEWEKGRKHYGEKRAVAMLAHAHPAGAGKMAVPGPATEAVAKSAFRAEGGPGDLGGARRWIVDSGASHHMTGEATVMTNLGPCDPVYVALADGGKRVATKMGTAVIQGMAGVNGVDLTLNDVLVVPGLTVSLFTVRVATKLGHEVLDCDARRRLHCRLAVGRWSVTLMVPGVVRICILRRNRIRIHADAVYLITDKSLN